MGWSDAYCCQTDDQRVATKEMVAIGFAANLRGGNIFNEPPDRFWRK